MLVEVGVVELCWRLKFTSLQFGFQHLTEKKPFGSLFLPLRCRDKDCLERRDQADFIPPSYDMEEIRT